MPAALAGVIALVFVLFVRSPAPPASIDIVFSDDGISQPTSFLVLSIEDHGIMELQLHFRRD